MTFNFDKKTIHNWAKEDHEFTTAMAKLLYQQTLEQKTPESKTKSSQTKKSS